MSWQASAWAFRSTAKSTRKLIVMILAEYASPTGVCWPSISTLSKIAGLGERTVQACIIELEKDRFITVSRSFDRSSVYTLNMAAGAAAGVDQPPADFAGIEDQPPAGFSAVLGHPPAKNSKKPAKSAPEPIIEPIKEVEPTKTREIAAQSPKVVKAAAGKPADPAITPKPVQDAQGQFPWHEWDHLTPKAPGTKISRAGYSQAITRLEEGKTTLEFERWYAAYPRKEAVGHAFKQYAQVIKGGRTAEELLSAILAQQGWLMQKERHFIKHPATWLSAGAFDDDVPSHFDVASHPTSGIKEKPSSWALKELLGSYAQPKPHFDIDGIAETISI